MQRELITLTVTAIGVGGPVALSMRNQVLDVLDYDDDEMRRHVQCWLDAKFGGGEYDYHMAACRGETWRC